MNDNDVMNYPNFAAWLRANAGTAKGSQRRLAQTLGIGKSAVSEFFSGRKVPRDADIGTLVAMFGKSVHDLEDLYTLPELEFRDYVTARNVYKRASQTWPLPRFMSDVAHTLEREYWLHALGLAEDAQTSMDVWRERIEQRLDTEQIGQYQITQEMLELGRLLTKTLTTQMEIAITASPVPHQSMKEYFSKLRGLRQEIRDPAEELNATSLSSVGSYLAQDYDGAIRVATDLFNPADYAEYYFRLLRVLLLGHAYQGNTARYDMFERITQDYLDGHTIAIPSQRATLYEAQGRARVILGLPNWESAFDKAEQECIDSNAQGRPLSLRELQIRRSRLVAFSETKRTGDPQAEKLTREALAIARRGSPRYIILLKRLSLELGIFERLKGEFDQ